jgi:hypothetical protein
MYRSVLTDTLLRRRLTDKRATSSDQTFKMLINLEPDPLGPVGAPSRGRDRFSTAA